MTAISGTYRARALSGGLSFASTGKERVGIDFEITEGAREGQRLTWWGYFTDLTVERTIESLRVCGWEGDDLTDLTGIEKNPVDLVVEPEEYTDRNGEIKTISRIKWINRPSMSVRDGMTSEQAREFAARMRGRVVALRGGKAPVASKPAPRRVAPAPQTVSGSAALKQAIDDDEIPFIYNDLEFSSQHRSPKWLRW